MLSLLEEVVLLAVDERTGELQSACECRTEYALAAAVLFDMALGNKIDTDTEEIAIVDREPTDNPVLDNLLEAMSERPDLTTVQQWIEEFVRRGDDFEGQALDALTERGILRHERTKRLWVINVERFPLLDPQAREFVRQRLRRAILTDEIPEPRDIMLVSLADACGLLRAIEGEGILKQRRERIEMLCNLETISRKVAAAISNLEALRNRVITKGV